VWVHSIHGFFSLVSARQGDGGHHQPVDPSLMMLRARCRDHLERLRRRFPALLADADVLESATADYPFRLLLPKPTAEKLVVELVREIQWDNFKNQAATIHGHPSPYLRALHDTWSVMRRLDPRQQ
jgi:hypothetical protein